MSHPGPEIPAIPFLGTSWYRRGGRYWFRRTAFFLGAALIAAFPVWFVCIIFSVIAHNTRSWIRIALLAAAIIAICWSLFTGFRSTTRAKHAEQLLLAGHEGGPEAAPEQASKTAGLGLGAAAYGGSVIAGGLVVVGQLFIVGWLAAFLVKASGRYLGLPEIRAMLAVKDWYEQHPEIPNNQRPKQFRQ